MIVLEETQALAAPYGPKSVFQMAGSEGYVNDVTDSFW